MKAARAADAAWGRDPGPLIVRGAWFPGPTTTLTAVIFCRGTLRGPRKRSLGSRTGGGPLDLARRLVGEGGPARQSGPRLGEALAEHAATHDREAFPEVFLLHPPARNATWARQVAGRIRRFQAVVGEGRRRIGEEGAGAGGDSPENERGRQLGELERRDEGPWAAIARRGGRAG